MIGCSKKKRKIIQENACDQKKKKPRLKFNPRLALIGLKLLGPDVQKVDSNMHWINHNPLNKY